MTAVEWLARRRSAFGAGSPVMQREQGLATDPNWAPFRFWDAQGSWVGLLSHWRRTDARRPDPIGLLARIPVVLQQRRQVGEVHVAVEVATIPN